MAYVSGNASSFADLLTALQNAMLADGWTLVSTGVYSKEGVFVKLSSQSTYIEANAGTGNSGSTLINPSPYAHRIGYGSGTSMTFPITYEIHSFSNPCELICVINYNSSQYQQLSFGKSSVSGIVASGSAPWITASLNSYMNFTYATLLSMQFNTATGNLGTYSSANSMSGGLFYEASVGGASSCVYTNLDTSGWRICNNSMSQGYCFGANHIAGILTSLPNLATNATVLVPIKAVQVRPSNGLTVVAQLQNIRYVRIDGYAPGDIVTFGTDKWKIYPLLAKNTVMRNPDNNMQNHSGTFGYAVRYTGV